MEDHLVGRALLPQDPQHVGVRLAIVDHQRLAHPLGQRDVPAEVLLLRGRLGAVPVVVQPRFADGHHPRVGGQPLEFGVAVVVQPVDLGGVDRDGGVDVGVLPRRRHAPLRRRDRVADRDRREHPGRPRVRHRLRDERRVRGHACLVRHRVEVRMRVEHRRVESWPRCGDLVGVSRRSAAKPGGGRGRHWPNLPSSSSTTDGSSLVNTGVGAASGRPTSIGADSHRAPVS